MAGFEYSQLVHLGLEMATQPLGARTADVKAATLVLWCHREIVQYFLNTALA